MKHLGIAAAGLALAAGCGATGGGYGSKPAAATTPSGSAATSFGTASVDGLGTVLVDGRGRTLYVLTGSGRMNLPCDGTSGCTSLWPDLPLPSGAGTKAVGGASTALVSTVRSGSTTYPTYSGWRVYEYAGDTGPAQKRGEGQRSFGGTWYALTPQGKPVTTSPASGGYGY